MEKIDELIFNHLGCEYHKTKLVDPKGFEASETKNSRGLNSYTRFPIVVFGKVYGVNAVKIYKDNSHYATFINELDKQKYRQNQFLPLIPERHRLFIDAFIKVDKYEKYNIKLNKGLLLSGVPGNGKTQILRYIEVAYGAWFLNMKDFLDDFSMIQSSNSSDIECIDDIDLEIFNEKDPRSYTFLSLLDDGKGDQIRFFTTNKKIDKIPPAFLRPGRINEIYYIDNPTREDREDFFKDFPVNLTDDTDGFSYAKLQFLKMCIIDTDFDIDKAWKKFNNQIQFSECKIGFA